MISRKHERNFNELHSRQHEATLIYINIIMVFGQKFSLYREDSR